jgi:chromosome segregation ATPase
MKILNEVIRFGKAFGQLTQVSQIAVAVILIVVAFSVGNCNGKTELDSFLVEYQELQNTAKKTTAYADSLQNEVTQLADSAKRQDDKIKKLTISISFREQQKVAQVRQLAQLESRVEAAKADSNLVVVVATQDTVITNLKEQVTTTEAIVVDQKQVIQAQATQVLALNQALTLSTMRGDSLQTVLSSLPKAPSNPNKFFFGLIPKPNRTTIAIVSLAAGVVVGSQIGK